MVINDYQEIMKKIIYFAILAIAASVVSCTTDVIGGTVNDPNEYADKTIYEWFVENEPSVAVLFEKAELKDKLSNPEETLTIIGPSRYAVNRYVRRKNYDFRMGSGVEYNIDTIPAAEAAKMSMYVYEGVYNRETLAELGGSIDLVAIDDSTECQLFLEETNTDPGCAYDGGQNPGHGFQYSNFLQQKPILFNALFKRGEKWERTFSERSAMGYETAETDQCYRMMISDVRCKNGVVHLVYSGDTSFDEHYHYHSLFFFGSRASDK